MAMRERYIEISEKLRARILDGDYAYGHKLPSETELGKMLGVSRMTMRKSVDLLINDGLLVRKRPLGTFVAVNERKSVRDMVDSEFHMPSLLSDRKTVLNLEVMEVQPAQLAFWKEVASLFEREQSGVKIELITSQRLRNIDQSSINPDVVILPTWSIPHYLDRDLLTPINGKIDGASHHAIFEDFPQFGYPFMVTTGISLLNIDIVKEKKLDLYPDSNSFDEFRNFLDSTTKKMKKSCVFISSSSLPAYIACAGHVDTKELQHEIPDLVAPIWDYFFNLVKKHPVSVRNHGQFEDGEIPLTYAPMGTLPHFKSVCRFAFTRNTSFPLLPNSPRRYMGLGACVSSKSLNVALAETLAEFLSRSKVQRLIVDYQFGLPASSTIELEGFEKTLSESLAKYGKPFDFNSKNVPEFMETVFMPISEQVMSTRITPDEGVKRLREAIEKYHANLLGWNNYEENV